MPPLDAPHEKTEAIVTRRAADIVKTFPGVVALKNVTFEARAGVTYTLMSITDRRRRERLRRPDDLVIHLIRSRKTGNSKP